MSSSLARRFHWLASPWRWGVDRVCLWTWSSSCRQWNCHGQAAAGCLLRAQGSRHSLDQPARQGEAEADAAGVVPISEPLERLEDLVPLSFGYAWTAVDDADLDSRAVAAGSDLRRGVRRAVANSVLDQVTIARSSNAGSACTSGVSSGTRMVAPAPRGRTRLVTAEDMTSAASIGWIASANAPAWRRPMSSRFSTTPLNRSNDSSAVASSSARSPSLSGRSDMRRVPTAALADASGVRKSWLTALSSAVL